jgi:hypothetical protein
MLAYPGKNQFPDRFREGSFNYPQRLQIHDHLSVPVEGMETHAVRKLSIRITIP